ncbi:MAG: hypothetical protein WBY94_02215 [Polyangiaceae bacterium]
MSGGALDASVTLDEVLAVVGAKRVPLAPELAGYLVLEIAEHADPIGGNIDPKSVFVGEEGTVALVKPKRDRKSGDAEASIREVLGRLLEASGSQTPALAAASKRKNGAGLPALAEELDAALIPVNRAAGRRALARLAREVKRVTLGVGRHTLPSSPPPPSPRRAPASAFSAEEDPTVTRAPKASPKHATLTDATEMPTTEFVPDRGGTSHSEADVDSLIAQFNVSGGGEQQHARALRAIAELDPTPAPPRRLADRPEPNESAVEELLAMRSDPTTIAAPAPPTKRVPHVSRGFERQLPTQPSHLKKHATSASAPHLDPRRGWWSATGFAVAAVAAGSYAIWWLRSDVAVRRQPPAAAAASIAPSPKHDVPPACVGALVVTDVPLHAEVLVHEGQAPVDILRMPVGARLEFVATAEGYAPKRVVVPAGPAGWDPGPDGKPRFEAAVQLDPFHPRAGGGDPWPAGEPGSAVGGEGPPGTVRVVATPRGAEVWMLAGIGPEAQIEHLACDHDIEVLLAGPTTYRKRLRVRAADFLAADPNAPGEPGKPRVARISGK